MDRMQYEAKIWDMFYKTLEPTVSKPQQICTKGFYNDGQYHIECVNGCLRCSYWSGNKEIA
jgi:hypothetical protein